MIFFTLIKSADFCDIRFHGPTTPYEQTQGVSYLQIETNRNKYSRNLDKNSKIVQKCDFFRFLRFFLRRYMRRIFVIFFFLVHLHHMNKHKEFHIYRLKPIGNKIRASLTKTGKSSKNLTFSDFHDFFYANIFSGFL